MSILCEGRGKQRQQALCDQIADDIKALKEEAADLADAYATVATRR